MNNTRLTLAIEGDMVSLPETGNLVVFGARADHDLSALPKDTTQMVQGFYPDHMALEAQGFSTSTTAETGAAAAIVFLPRARAEARAMLVQAMQITGGGPVIVDGQKTDGIDSMLKDCKKHGCVIGTVYSKAHGKIFTINGGDFTDWNQPSAQQTPDGFVTAPGVFSADSVDRGSAALAAVLPEKLKGVVADLGAGWGYLAHRVLQYEAVREVHLIEASHAALECARHNITDPRAQFHWADATTYKSAQAFDHVVCNPPFHTGRTADPALGRAFIAASARMLAGRGTLWLVANRHLPYEATLAEAFIEVELITGDPSFKLFRAAKPRRKKR